MFKCTPLEHKKCSPLFFFFVCGQTPRRLERVESRVTQQHCMLGNIGVCVRCILCSSRLIQLFVLHCVRIVSFQNTVLYWEYSVTWEALGQMTFFFFFYYQQIPWKDERRRASVCLFKWLQLHSLTWRGHLVASWIMTFVCCERDMLWWC